MTEVPLIYTERLPLVDVSVNGHTVRMVLDTGATNTVISPAAAERVGAKPDPRFIASSSGIGGSARSRITREVVLSLGAAKMPITHANITDISPAFHAEGLLGVDALRHYEIEVNPTMRSVGLYNVRLCDSALPPWTGTFVSPRGLAHGKAAFYQIMIPIKYDSAASMAILDTGAAGTGINRSMLQPLGLSVDDLATDRNVIVASVGKTTAEMRLHRFKSVTIGGMRASDVFLPIWPDNTDDSFGGIVGQDVLGGRNLWISLATARIFILCVTVNRSNGPVRQSSEGS